MAFIVIIIVFVNDIVIDDWSWYLVIMKKMLVMEWSHSAAFSVQQIAAVGNTHLAQRIGAYERKEVPTQIYNRPMKV